ncbi:hypothetical protein L218DRAFT_1006842 [Marasmius fiardii PR-910]|nr:hypothetical protein L218DRAFT_1006842 [Marasmius fiardii PR-910]
MEVAQPKAKPMEANIPWKDVVPAPKSAPPKLLKENDKTQKHIDELSAHIEELDANPDDGNSEDDEVAESEEPMAPSVKQLFDNLKSVDRPQIPEDHVIERSNLMDTWHISPKMSTTDLIKKPGALNSVSRELPMAPIPKPVKQVHFQGTDEELAEQLFKNKTDIMLEAAVSVLPAVRKILMRKLKNGAVRKTRTSAYIEEVA